eukprot:gene1105-3942_t
MAWERAVRLQELNFQMAVRDQIISEQREVIGNLWKIIDRSRMGRSKVLEIAKQEGIIMDGFFQLSEESTANDHEGIIMDGFFQLSEESTANDNRANGEASGHHTPPVIKKKRESMGMAGQDIGGGTPNASLAGNRAKMRYQFWQEYQGVGGTKGHGGAAGGGDGGEESTSGDEGGPPPVSDAVVAKVGRAGGNNATAPPTRSAAVAAAMRGVGNNQSAPVVQSGRRAGQPVNRSAQQLDLVEDSEDADLEGILTKDLPKGQFGEARRTSLDQGTAHVEASSRAGSAAGAGRAATAGSGGLNDSISRTPPLPPVPPQQISLGERLAKLRGRLGRRSEADAVAGLPDPPPGGWEPKPPSQPMSVHTRSPSPRLSSAGGLVEGGGSAPPPIDALDVLKQSLQRRGSHNGSVTG